MARGANPIARCSSPRSRHPTSSVRWALVTGEPRSADVVAVTDVECFRLPKESFEKVLLARPEIAHGLSDRIAKRQVELLAARDGLDAASQKSKHLSEAERIKRQITKFFGL
jgi:CRP-like cAMP-binding protein